MPTIGRTYSKEYRENRGIVLERDDYVCQICRNDLDRHPTVDTPFDHYPTAGHRVPWIYTQDDSVDNMQAECKRCNFAKGAKVQTRNAWSDPDLLDDDI